jgi:hypothetical protein
MTKRNAIMGWLALVVGRRYVKRRLRRRWAARA